MVPKGCLPTAQAPLSLSLSRDTCPPKPLSLCVLATAWLGFNGFAFQYKTVIQLSSKWSPAGFIFGGVPALAGLLPGLPGEGLPEEVLAYKMISFCFYTLHNIRTTPCLFSFPPGLGTLVLGIHLGTWQY